MATSGYARTNTAFGWVQLRWSLASQDTVNNKSTINWYLEIYSSSSIYSSDSKSYSVKINGSTVSSGSDTIGGSGTRTLKSGTTTIAHNSDGTKTFSYSFSQECAITWSGTYVGTVTGSGSDTLPTIPRASQPSLSDMYVWMRDETVTIYTNRASTTFTHTITYKFGNASGTIATGVTDSTTWTPPLSLANEIPNDTYDNGTVYCETFDSTGTSLGKKSTTIQLYVPSDVVPTFTSVTASEANTTVANAGVGYVQGLSKLNMVINGASGAYSSTITKYTMTFENNTYTGSSAVSSTIKGSGALTLSGTITDSRGRTATQNTTITVSAYTSPKITTFTVARANSDGTSNSIGEYVNVGIGGTWTDLSAKNDCTILVKTSARGANTWTTVQTIDGGTGGSYNNTITVGTYPPTSSFDFRLEFTDLFNTTISITVLSTGQVTMSWGQTGVGVGKVWEQGALDVSGDAFISGTIYAGGLPIIPSGIVNMFAGGTVPSGWLVCDGSAISRTTYANLFNAIGTTYGAGDGSTTFNLPNFKGSVPVGLDTGQTEFNALGKTGGEKTHTLTVNEMPSHRHEFKYNNSNTQGTVSYTHATNAFANQTTDTALGFANMNNTGGDAPHNNLQPYITLNFIIKI